MRRDRRTVPPARRAAKARRPLGLFEPLEGRALLSVTVNDPKVVEGNASTSVPFVISLTSPADHVVSVDYYTTDGTASSPADYTSTTGTVTFQPGETGKLVMVPVIGDAIYEANETFNLNLLNPLGDTISRPSGTATILDDDLPPSATIADATQDEGNVGATNLALTVQLSAASQVPAVLTYSTADISAMAGSDYQAVAGTLTFAPGETSKTIIVPVIGNTISQGDRTFAVNLSPVSGVTIGRSQAVVLIHEDDAPVGLFIDDASVVQGSVGNSSAIFNVHLAAPSGQTVTVNYATADGTAKAGTDYLATSGTLTFAPGETSKSVIVPVLPSSVPAGARQFTVNLSSPSNTTISRAQATGTITNNVAGPNLSIADVSVIEGNSGTANVLVNVSLSSPSAVAVSVNYTTSNITAIAGSDYQATSGTLTFAPGQTVQAIAIPIVGDTNPEANELFAVNLSGASGALISRSQGIVTILDDDITPIVTIDNVSQVEGNAGTTDAVFHVTLSSLSPLPITVNYATSNITALAGTDYTPTSGMLTFAPGESVKTITVSLLGDAIQEPDETFAVNLSGASNATITVGRGVGTILDDDQPPLVSIDDISTVEGDAGTTNAVLTVQLSSPSGFPVVVNYATDDLTAIAGVDYVPRSGQVTLAPGQTSVLIAIPIIGDTLHEADKSFAVNLSGPSNAVFGASQAIVTILDDDPTPSVSVADTTVVEPAFGTAGAVFTVTLSAPSAQAVTVNYTTVDGTAAAFSDYQPTSGSLTFAPGETSKTVTVSVLGDTLFESNETFLLVLSPPDNASLARPFASATIRDDDPLPSLSIGDVTVSEGSFSTTIATFTVSLSSPSGATTTVNYATSDGSAFAGTNYSTTTGTLTFAPGETTKTINVPVLDDFAVRGNTTFFVTLSAPANATINRAQGAATITDSDATIVTSTADDGPGSLRQAIRRANLAPGVDTITFNLPGIGPFEIDLRSALPAITDPVVIDATSQPGFPGSPDVLLNGTSAGPDANGLFLVSGNSTIRGLAIGGFAGSAIYIQGRGGNVVQGNYLGVATDGNTPFGNQIYGVLIDKSPANLIGGATAGAGNLISGNGLGGIYIGFGASSGNIVRGNLIGTNALGTVAVPNGLNGILIDNAPANLIGGGGLRGRNVISGNGTNGIHIFGAGSVLNRVQGNIIGLGSAGRPAIPNRGAGILITQVRRSRLTIGGRGANNRNIVSANGGGSIRVAKRS